MNRFFTYIQSSLDNFTQGASAKKLTAFILTLLVIYLHLRFASSDNGIEYLIADLSAILGLFGVNTFEKIKRKQNDTEKNIVEPSN